ncbi:MAG TPA: serine hydrolase domain-containing protein, partial [Saprospiraceae bacterium]|nr:serine hydrolase domain-containing protein [Saprospiraceae bacterium]
MKMLLFNKRGWWCLLFPLPLGVMGQPGHFKHEIEKFIRHETQIDFTKVPTIVTIAHSKSFGSIDTIGQGLRQGPNDPAQWELGSLTKPIAAFLAEQVLDSMGIGVDTKVCTVLPDTLCHDHWAQITFRQLLEHRAGLPLITPQMGLKERDVHDPYQDYDLHAMIGDIQQIDPVPNQYSYSHFGYAVLYWLFEKVGGFDQAMYTFCDKIFERKFPTEVEDQLLIQGHGLDGRMASPWHTNALEPALGLRTEPIHYARFILSCMPAIREEYPVLSPALRKDLAKQDQSRTYKIAHGWFVFRSGKSVVFYQNGHTGGFFVSAAFIPAEDIFVVVFSNGASGT